jgi:hypothetical protein
MLRKAIWAWAIAVCLLAPAVVRAQGDYLDVYIVKIKPDKAADFYPLARKIADANRRYNGDRWLAAEVLYGEGDTFMFTSTRQDYADVQKGNDVFMGALNKAYGKEAAEKMLHDWESCITSSRTELRRRRWDLSRKVPTDPAAYAKLIGESRLLRTTAVHIKPGHTPEFEALMKDTKEAGEKNPNTQPVLVSQVVEGGKGTVFYVSGLRASLGGFDKNPTTRDILGEEGYKKFLQVSSEAVESADSMLLRFSAELSNPPEEIAQVATDFWRPKQTVAAASPKQKGPGGGDKGAQVQPTSAKPQ